MKGASRERKAAKTEVGNVSESGVKLASTNMTLAITSGRLLIFKFGSGRSAKPEFPLTNVPIGDVDSIQVGDSRLMTRPVTVTVQGESFELEVRRAVNTDTLINAFAQVKSGTPGIALGGGLEGSSGSLPPADWYADPQHVARLRYWDGGQWTDNTAP